MVTQISSSVIPPFAAGVLGANVCVFCVHTRCTARQLFFQALARSPKEGSPWSKKQQKINHKNWTKRREKIEQTMKLLRRTSLLHGSDGSKDVHLLRGTAEVVLVEGRNLAIRDSCGTALSPSSATALLRKINNNKINKSNRHLFSVNIAYQYNYL
jgi:hypothetical protein